MQNLYSLAISPPDAIISSVRSMKEQLAEKVGWFHSKNSMAHITINEFMATDTEIETIKKQLTSICDSLKPMAVYFDKYDTYPNGAFFMAPDEDSKNGLKAIMKQIHQSLRVKTLFKSNEPHMSIARKLKPEAIAAAHRLFTATDLNFLCDNLVLRRFNPNIKQFEITDHFEFNDNPNATFVQGSLF